MRFDLNKSNFGLKIVKFDRKAVDRYTIVIYARYKLAKIKKCYEIRTWAHIDNGGGNAATSINQLGGSKMNTRNRLSLDMGRRAQGFLNRLIPTITTVPPALATLKAKLDTFLAQADVLAKEQQSDAYAISVRKRAELRRVLHKQQLRALARVSKLIANANPGFTHLVSVPPKDTVEEDLLTIAKAAVANATQQKALFEKYGMPVGLLDAISSTVAGIVAERAAGKVLLTTRIAATAGLEVTAKRVSLTVRAISPTLRALFDTLGERAAELEAAWKRASRGYQVPESAEPGEGGPDGGSEAGTGSAGASAQTTLTPAEHKEVA